MPLFRLAFLLSLLALLGSCSVFHSRQKDKLRMPANMEAEYKAKEKARHKGLTYKPADDNAGKSTDAKDAKADDSKKLTYKDLPEGTKRKYDKEGLIKNHLPAPTPRHTYDRFKFKGTEANKENRKLRHHKKKGDKDHAPAPEKAKDAAAPAGKDAPADAPAPAEAPAPKAD